MKYGPVHGTLRSLLMILFEQFVGAYGIHKISPMLPVDRTRLVSAIVNVADVFDR